MNMTGSAVGTLDCMVGDDRELRVMLEKEQEKSRVARMIYEARTTAGLTQAELAARAGTRPWVIARLEDADYDGHTLDMLARIARSLDQRMEVRLVPRLSEARAAA